MVRRASASKAVNIIDRLVTFIERHPFILLGITLLLILFYPDLEPERFETVTVEVPPCDDCTKPQLRVWTVGNQNKLIMPRVGNGPWPHID